jgi:hypothetical protein
MIVEFAVTAVVFTVTLVAAAGSVNAPAGADPQTAGDALLEQFETVRYAE